MKKIKSFEDACKALGIDPTKLPEVSMLPEQHRNAIIAYYKLFIIAEALNEGWKPNWNDSDEWKYYPWLWVTADADNTAGSGLSFSDFVCTNSISSVGSRLCFKTRELAKYAGEQFTELYAEAFLFLKK
ncbi:MAG: hypothetical protein AB7G44_03490 [Bacteroidia bacterium]